MKKIVLLSVVFLTLLSYGVAFADNASATKVTVVNTSANPVPVTGNLGITGTPNVNVTNTPNVNITNASVSIAPQTTTTVLPPTAYTAPVTITLDTSKCSKVRVQYVARDSGLTMQISDGDVGGQIDFIANSFGGSIVVDDMPPPSLSIETIGSSDYSLVVYCR